MIAKEIQANIPNPSIQNKNKSAAKQMKNDAIVDQAFLFFMTLFIPKTSMKIDTINDYLIPLNVNHVFYK